MLAVQVQLLLASGGKYHHDAGTQADYVVKGDQWISDEKPGLPPAVAVVGDPPLGSLARKARFIQRKGLAGAMFWEVILSPFTTLSTNDSRTSIAKIILKLNCVVYGCDSQGFCIAAPDMVVAASCSTL